MGIYCNNSIFGIKIYNHTNTLFEEKYNVIMNDKQKNEAYLFYSKLDNKNEIFFNIYTECSSTYNINNKETFMMWYKIPLDMFLKNFNIGNQ